MAITLRDVAARAGVSTSAVSRTFTSGASVSPTTRDRVLRAAAALGYQPNVLASALSSGRTKLIGLVANNFHNPFLMQVFDLFTDRLQARGLRPLLVNLSDERDPSQSVQMLRQYSVDGVILASSTLPTSFASAFRAAGLPVVHCFGRSADQPDVHVVGIDNVACGRMAAQVLAGRGYGTVGFLGGPSGATSTQDRQAGFVAACGALGLPATVDHATDYTFSAGRQAMQALIARGPAQAYFCGDDVLSIGALSALRDAGLRPGQDVGVIGLNDMEMAGWNGIDLTTIRQPLDRIVGAAVEMVAAILNDPGQPPETRLFGCDLVERATLRPLPGT